MGCKSCDSEDSPAIFLSAVAIGNQALQNTIYPGMQGDTELSKGTPVNPFLAKKIPLVIPAETAPCSYACRFTHKPALYKLRQTTEMLAQAPGICTPTVREWQVSSHTPGAEQTLNKSGCCVFATADSPGLCGSALRLGEWVKLLWCQHIKEGNWIRLVWSAVQIQGLCTGICGIT